MGIMSIYIDDSTVDIADGVLWDRGQRLPKLVNFSVIAFLCWIISNHSQGESSISPTIKLHCGVHVRKTRCLNFENLKFHFPHSLGRLNNTLYWALNSVLISLPFASHYPDAKAGYDVRCGWHFAIYHKWYKITKNCDIPMLPLVNTMKYF